MSTVRIMVAPGMDFDIPARLYLEARTFATLRNKVWFVGVKGEEFLVHPDREYLLEQGCEQIAWICPMRGEA
jgi:hypothetical protein